MTLCVLSDEDGIDHIESLLKSKDTAKRRGTLGFEDSDTKRLLFFNSRAAWRAFFSS